MSRIKNKSTSIEVRVRHFLFSKGYRYRVNVKSLPGKPDIVLTKYKTVIFIHGCFWHRHEGCKEATIPKTRTEFWLEKFGKNIENDQKHEKMLQDLGWKVITLWQCEIEKDFDHTMNGLIAQLQLG